MGGQLMPAIKFPKIFAIGQRNVEAVFQDHVEVTEKIDGSSLAFGMLNGELRVCTRRTDLFPGQPAGMFQTGLDYIVGLASRMPEGWRYYGEYLFRPKHNCLKYDRVPHNNIALFGVQRPDGTFCAYDELLDAAALLDIGFAPLLMEGNGIDLQALTPLLERESVLGGVKIEGVVIKNYHRPSRLVEVEYPIMCAKLVSEQFKERQHSDWRNHTGKGKWETYCESFRAEARWNKAIQARKEAGEFLGAPQDIGPLIRLIQEDIKEEEIEGIKEMLWKEYGPQLLRIAIQGFPDYFKEKLQEGAYV